VLNNWLFDRLKPALMKWIRALQPYVQTLEQWAAWWHHRPSDCLLAGLISGVLLATFTTLSPTFIALFLLALATLWWPWPHRHLQGCYRLLLIGCTLSHLGVSWQQRALPPHHIAHRLPHVAQQRLQIEGTLDRAVDARHNRQYLFLQLQRLYGPRGWQSTVGRVRLNLHTAHVTLLPGDHIRVEQIRLHPVRNFQNPRHDDFRTQMHRQDVYAVSGVSRPERIRLLERPQRWRMDRMFAQWRQAMLAHIQEHLRPPADAVLAAIVLGQRGALTPDIEQAFQTAGLAHLLVVSGLHVGFVVVASFISIRTLCRYLRSWLPRAWLPALRPTPIAALLSMTPLLLYCSLVGWKVSTTRAAIMASSYLLALAVSRQRDPLQSVSLAAVLVLLLDPTALFTPGFQLSFVAVTTILLASGRFTFQRLTGWRRALCSGGLATSAAFLGTIPLLANTFYAIPIYSPLTNFILLPLISFLVPTGLFVLLLTNLWPALAGIAFVPLAPLLAALTTLAHYIAARPEALYYTAPLPAAAIAGYYSLLVCLLLMSRPGFNQRLRWSAFSLCALLLLVGIGWDVWTLRPRHLRVMFLDVGTGDAIWIQTPEGHNILVDGGGTYNGQFDIGARVVAPVLWGYYIGRFDLMALTHMHPNHGRGLASLYQLFGAQHLLTNGSPMTADYLQAMLDLSAQRGTSIHTAQTGPRHWQWGSLQLNILSPPRHASRQPWQPPTENDRSLVLRLQYGQVRMLLTGDIQHATEQWLVEHIDDLRADILHVPHHGSRTSTHPDLIQQVQPKVAIITAGSGNPYGHPHPRVLATLAQHRVRVFRTDCHGAITIISDGATYQIETAITTPCGPLQPVQIPSP
jgi:competence protein ComEC